MAVIFEDEEANSSYAGTKPIERERSFVNLLLRTKYVRSEEEAYRVLLAIVFLSLFVAAILFFKPPSKSVPQTDTIDPAVLERMPPQLLERFTR